MSILEGMRLVMAETKARGDLSRYEPIPMLSMPWEAPARWRVGADVWEALKREAEEIAGPYNVVSDTARVTVYGYPLVVDEDAVAGMFVLEPIPDAANEAVNPAPEGPDRA